MSLGSEIRNKIRQLSGTHESEDVEYAIGEVIEINTDPNLMNTCKVKLLSSRTVNGEILFVDNGNSPFANKISDTDKEKIQSHFEGLILNNVSMSVSGGTKNSLSIPTIGSNVIVMMSRYQQPFIAQYSDIQYGQTSYSNGNVINLEGYVTVLRADGSTFSTNGNAWVVKDNNGENFGEVELYSDTDNNNYPKFEANIGLGKAHIGNNSTQIEVDCGLPQVVMGAKNIGQISIVAPVGGTPGINILSMGSSKIFIQSVVTNDSLGVIISDLINVIETGVDTGGFFMNPAGVSLLEAIKIRLGALLG